MPQGGKEQRGCDDWPPSVTCTASLAGLGNDDQPGGVDGASDGVGGGGRVSERQLDGVNPVLTVTDISLKIERPPGTVIFSCSASDPNGLTDTVSLTC